MTDTDQPFYIPVEPPLSTERLAALTEHQLQHRTLDDPAYAGFDPTFDWRDHITLLITNPVFNAEVTQALDEWSATEQGQHSIRQAHAVRLLKLQQSPDPAAAFAPNHPQIIISEVDDCSEKSSTEALAELGIIHLGPHDLQHVGELMVDGSNQLSVLREDLAHEMGHLKDPLLVLPNYDGWIAAHDAKFNQALATSQHTLLSALDLPWTGTWKNDITYADQHLPIDGKNKLHNQLAQLKDDNEESRESIWEYPAIVEGNKERRAQKLPERAMVHNEGDYIPGTIAPDENCPAPQPFPPLRTKPRER